MAKTCSHTGCSYPVFSKGLCQNHWRGVYGKPIQKKVAPAPRYKLTQTIDGKQAKPFKAIPKVSSKMDKIKKAYAILRGIFLREHNICQARWEGCTVMATQVHHARGRTGGYMLDDTTFRAVCDNCHRLIEQSPQRAKDAGLSESRLNKSL